MSNRETQLKSFTLSAIGGVNERVYLTELPPEQYSSLIGLFPEFTGLQSRIYGKRLLKQYANPIYSIYQAWTPYGYGVGLYQFTGEIDFGYWLTPTSNFDFTLPDLGIDLGGFTLDDFGNSYGSQFDYSDQNACVISFLENSTDHSACAPAPSNVGTPDDSNGGPAGQGMKCKYEEAIDDFDLSDLTLSQVFGSTNTTTQISNTDNCRNPADGQNPPCVAFPPLPQPIIAGPSLSYTTQTVDGIISCSKNFSSFAVFVSPTNLICTFRVQIAQTSVISNNKLTINLSPLLSLQAESISLVVTRTPGGEIELALPITDQDQILSGEDYLLLPTPTANADAGFNQIGSVTGNTIRVRRRRRVCV